MITERELQTAIPHAISRMTLAKRVADAVIAETKVGEYLRGSELIHKSKVKAEVRDHSQLSIVLSEAYSQGLIGREFSPMGRERYAYGHPAEDKKSGVTKRRVIKAPVLGYAVCITKSSAEEVLEIMSAHPGAKFTKAVDGYQVRLTFGDKGKALDFLVESGLLIDGVKLVEVR